MCRRAEVCLATARAYDRTPFGVADVRAIASVGVEVHNGRVALDRVVKQLESLSPFPDPPPPPPGARP